MKTKKQIISAIAIYLIILGIYTLGFFIIPFEKGTASWMSFAFTIVAILSSLIMSKVAFSSKDVLVSRVYGFPIFRIGIFYAVIQFILGVLVCVIGAFVEIPYWIILLIYVILLGGAIVGVILTDNSRDTVEAIEETTKDAVKNITYFQINMDGIVDCCQDANVRRELEKLSEIIRFSDPVSSEATKIVEDQINEMLSDLRASVEEANAEATLELVRKITNTVKERNRICKACKK